MFLLNLIFVFVKKTAKLNPKNATIYLSAIKVKGDAYLSPIFVNIKLKPKITCAKIEQHVATAYFDNFTFSFC